jgi:hypothetical protein
MEHCENKETRNDMRPLALYEETLQYYYSSSIYVPFDTLQMSQWQFNSSHFHSSTSRSTCLPPMWSCKVALRHSYKVSMSVEQNGAQSRFHTEGRVYLSAVYPGKWIGREGPTARPPRSPYWTSSDSWMMSYMFFRCLQAYTKYMKHVQQGFDGTGVLLELLTFS